MAKHKGFEAGTRVIVEPTRAGSKRSLPAANWVTSRRVVTLNEYAPNAGTLDVLDVTLSDGSEESIYDMNIVGKAPARKIGNPSASCPRQSSKFNAYQGRTVKYRKKSYEIEGCGIGRTAKRSIGKQEEGTYALRALKTGKKKYVAKRVIRDLAYHRGGKAILGMPKRKKAVKNPSKRGKLTGAAKAEFLARMAAGRRRAGR